MESEALEAFQIGEWEKVLEIHEAISGSWEDAVESFMTNADENESYSFIRCYEPGIIKQIIRYAKLLCLKIRNVWD